MSLWRPFSDAPAAVQAIEKEFKPPHLGDWRIIITPGVDAAELLLLAYHPTTGEIDKFAIIPHPDTAL